MGLNVGKSIGRVSIRALPDTKDFRRDLMRKLKTEEKRARISVTVDKANVNRPAIRASIEKQLTGLDNIAMDADVRVIVAKAKIRRTALRKDIQEQFDKMADIRVGISAHIKNPDEFEHEVKKLTRSASRNKVSLEINAATAPVAARMKWLSRTRIVTFIPRVSEAAAAKVGATLLALSGARVAADWIDKLNKNLGSLDKNLPGIAAWTTGLTTLFGGLMGSISGVVGVGAGLVSMLPLLLTVPGLILNAGASLTVLIVALKNAKEELGELGPAMTNLGKIINTEFWDRARDPIVEMTRSLMPQLEAAFANVAAGVGDFTGQMSNAFQRELGDGRLLSIFDNIAEGWNILAGGADGFAGALVNLSEIAARYTPRLSKWFVRQADTFDAWLTAIATDGRLEQWMNDAIDSTYQLWDATTGIAGVFAGIWKAAKAAGGGGLKGFSEMMKTWERVVNGPKFQRATTALFRGSNVAMSALSGAVKKVGDLIHDLAPDLEHFIGVSGEIFGGLLGAVADSLNTPEIGSGLTKFIDGLAGGTDKFSSYLPRISDGLDELWSFVGELGNQIGPVLGATLAGLSEVLAPLMSYLETEVLPTLGPALVGAIENLTPKIGELGEKLMPVIGSLADLAVTVLPAVESTLARIIDLLNTFTLPAWLTGTEVLNGFFNGAMWDDKALDESVDKIIKGGGLGASWFEWTKEYDQKIEDFFANMGTKSEEEGAKLEQSLNGTGGAGGRFGMSMIRPLQEAQPEWQTTWQGYATNLQTAWDQMTAGTASGVDNAATATGSLRGRTESAMTGVGSWLSGSGGSLIQGFIDGIRGMIPLVVSAVDAVVSAAADFFPHSPAPRGPFSGRGWSLYSGMALMDGFAEGIRARSTSPQLALATAFKHTVPALGGVGAAQAGTGAPNVQVDVHTAPGMDEPTVGRIVATEVSDQWRMAGG